MLLARPRLAAIASSGVGLPSRRSSPTGLPVSDGVAERAEHVVAQLERVAERQAVGGQRRRELAEPAGERGAEVQRPLDGVLARLVARDALGPRRGWSGRARGADDVEVLADVQLDAQLVPHASAPRRSRPRGTVGVDEREVADEDRHALAEPPGLAAPAVDRVAVAEVLGCAVRHAAARSEPSITSSWIERERVQQLERGAGVGDDRIVGVAAGADVAPVAERRPQPLPAREHEGRRATRGARRARGRALRQRATSASRSVAQVGPRPAPRSRRGSQARCPSARA